MKGAAAIVAFVGEQPMPIVLPALELGFSRLILLATERTGFVAENIAGALGSNVEVVPLKSAYDVSAIETDLGGCLSRSEQTILNLTGGTKAMTLAGYRVAERSKTPFVYQESESGRFVLWHYEWSDGALRAEKRCIERVLSLHDYLRCHGIVDPKEKDSPSDYETRVAGIVKDLVDEMLANRFISDNVEVDLILRTGHQYAVCEVFNPTGKNARIKPKIDQLVQATDRIYLGAYTKRVLITSRELDEQCQALAEARSVDVVVTGDDLGVLRQRIPEIMGTKTPGEA